MRAPLFLLGFSQESAQGFGAPLFLFGFSHQEPAQGFGAPLVVFLAAPGAP